MDVFELRWRSSTRKDLRRIASEDLPRIISAVESLTKDPYGAAIKLSGVDRTYRIRIGDYRVVYEVNASEMYIDVLRVRHRRDVYRN